MVEKKQQPYRQDKCYNHGVAVNAGHERYQLQVKNRAVVTRSPYAAEQGIVVNYIVIPHACSEKQDRSRVLLPQVPFSQIPSIYMQCLHSCR